MEQITIEISGSISLIYDQDSPEFKEAFSGYQEVIDPDATIEDMLKHVAFHVTRFGVDTMVEGVGYVDLQNRNMRVFPFSGITVKQGYDDFDFSI